MKFHTHRYTEKEERHFSPNKLNWSSTSMLANLYTKDRDYRLLVDGCTYGGITTIIQYCVCGKVNVTKVPGDVRKKENIDD